MLQEQEKADLIALRRKLHARPELSGKELETAQTIEDFIRPYAPNSIITNLGGHGILATWQGAEYGLHILIRSEMDALPISEDNDFEHKSVYENVSHKCGHDGHATILCGVAEYLNHHPLERGKVSLLFQPAEETGEGAAAVIKDGRFDIIKPDMCFSLHNLPGVELHEIVLKEDCFTPSVNSLIIDLEGLVAHAAEPEHGNNPAEAIAEILQKAMSLHHNVTSDAHMTVITPVYMHMGDEAYGVSAGKGTIHFTLRCWTDDQLRKVENEIVDFANEVSKKYGLTCSYSFTNTFYATNNNKKSVDIVRKSATTKGFRVTETDVPNKWGEDFGLFTAAYNGCMFGLGSGLNQPVLHNPAYDFPDAVIETGVKIFSGIIEEVLGVENVPEGWKAAAK